jgi:SurA N-terminal domain
MGFACQVALLLSVAGVCSAQAVVDRMVAVVNKRVILESELDQAARVQFLLHGKSLTTMDSQDTLATLDQLIDRSLLEQQIIHPAMLDPSPEEMAARVTEIRAQVPGAAGDEGWKTLLNTYGLTRQDIEEHVRSEFRVLRFVDLRFRGLVRVDKAAIAAYYQEKLLPELKKRGAAEPPLTEVSGKIEKILAEQRVDEMLNNWLQALRSQAHIEKMAPSSAGSRGANL